MQVNLSASISHLQPLSFLPLFISVFSSLYSHSLSVLCASPSWQIDSNDLGLILISSHTIAIITSPS